MEQWTQYSEEKTMSKESGHENKYWCNECGHHKEMHPNNKCEKCTCPMFIPWKKVEIDGELIDIEGDTATFHVYYMPEFDFQKLQGEEVDVANLVFPEDCKDYITKEEWDSMDPMDRFQAVFNLHTITAEEFYSKECRKCTCRY